MKAPGDGRYGGVAREIDDESALMAVCRAGASNSNGAALGAAAILVDQKHKVP
jgi:hypothetical protein